MFFGNQLFAHRINPCAHSINPINTVSDTLHRCGSAISNQCLKHVQILPHICTLNSKAASSGALKIFLDSHHSDCERDATWHRTYDSRSIPPFKKGRVAWGWVKLASAILDTTRASAFDRFRHFQQLPHASAQPCHAQDGPSDLPMVAPFALTDDRLDQLRPAEALAVDAVGGEKWRLREGYVSEGQEFLSLSPSRCPVVTKIVESSWWGPSESSVNVEDTEDESLQPETRSKAHRLMHKILNMLKMLPKLRISYNLITSHIISYNLQYQSHPTSSSSRVSTSHRSWGRLFLVWSALVCLGVRCSSEGCDQTRDLWCDQTDAHICVGSFCFSLLVSVIL